MKHIYVHKPLNQLLSFTEIKTNFIQPLIHMLMQKNTSQKLGLFSLLGISSGVLYGHEIVVVPLVPGQCLIDNLVFPDRKDSESELNIVVSI